jgi:hypothetical protein
VPAGRESKRTAATGQSCRTASDLDRIWDTWMRQRRVSAPARQSGAVAQPSPVVGCRAPRDAKAVFRKWIRDRLAAMRPAAPATPPAAPETPAARAEKLLLAFLTPEQRRQYREEGAILVPGRIHPQYRIRKGRVANVEVLDPQGQVLHRLCAHPAPPVPNADTMLAQLLMLNHHEQEFVATANRHPAW